MKDDRSTSRSNAGEPTGSRGQFEAEFQELAQRPSLLPEPEITLARACKPRRLNESAARRRLWLFIEAFWLAEKFPVVRSTTAFNANVRRTTDILLVDLEISLQQLLHFAERF